MFPDFHPCASLSPDVNHNLVQSLIEGGSRLDEVAAGEILEIVTDHHVYRLAKQHPGVFSIQGHPEYCPLPTIVRSLGSSWGGSMIKYGFIGRGMLLEFVHPTLGRIVTSPVRELRAMPPEPRA